MKLYELLQEVKSDVLFGLMSDDENMYDFIPIYKDIYKKLKTIPPLINDCKICFDDGLFVKNKLNKIFGLELFSWQHCLAMTIDDDYLNKFENSVILKTIIYEMTFITFEMGEIVSKSDCLSKLELINNDFDNYGLNLLSKNNLKKYIEKIK